MSFLVENYDISSGDGSWIDKVSVTDGATSFQFVVTGIDASDSVIKLQYSNDEVNFVDVPTLSGTLSSGDSVVTFDLTAITHRYFKAVFIANSSTTGTLDIIRP
jgi:hypothetical protein